MAQDTNQNRPADVAQADSVGGMAKRLLNPAHLSDLARRSAATKVNTQRTVLYKLNVVLLKTVISPKVILFHRTFSTMSFIRIQQIQENFKSYTHFVRR